jgi:hypothetical protein
MLHTYILAVTAQATLDLHDGRLGKGLSSRLRCEGPQNCGLDVDSSSGDIRVMSSGGHSGTRPGKRFRSRQHPVERPTQAIE